MVFLGAGMGIIVQVMVLAVQNAVEHRDLGTGTAVETFTRSMGSSFGVAAFGAILNNRLTYHLPRLVPKAALAHIDPRALVEQPGGDPPAASRRPQRRDPRARPLDPRDVPLRRPDAGRGLRHHVFLKETPLRETAYVTMPMEPGASAESVDVLAG